MNALLQDIAFAWRNALKQPATALLIVVTLALGIGANSAMFSMTWHVLMAPLPYADGDRLVRIRQNETNTGREDIDSSVQSFFDYRDQSSVFSDVIEYHSMQFTLLGHGDPMRVQTGVVTWNYFDVLGIRPLLGRTFAQGEDIIGAELLIVLSYEFWQNQFGGDPSVVGRTLDMNNATHTVIGVLPPIPAYPDANDIWITASSCPFRASDTIINNRAAPLLSGVFGKLREGVSLEQGTRDVDTVAQRLSRSFPEVYGTDRGYSADLRYLKDEMVGTSGTTFLLLLGMATLVVLIASANVANLNLARMSVRNQELAIREAIGANPARIARQLLTESVLYALAGGLLGLLIAYPCLSLLKRFAAGYTSLASEIHMDLSILGFSVAVSLLIGMVSGAASAFSRRDINRALKEGSGKTTAAASGTRRRQALLTVQFALSFFIITASLLILLSLYRLSHEDAGYDPAQLLVVGMDLNFTNYATPEQMRAIGLLFLREVEALPGVDEVALSAETPLQNATFAPVAFDVEGRSASDTDARPTARTAIVSENYFRVMHIPLLKGRMLEIGDDEDTLPVVLINESFETQHFPEGNALGQRLRLGANPAWRTIVGVVANVRSSDLNQVEGARYYTSFRQNPTSSLDLFVRSTRDPAELGRAITALIHGIDPQQAVHSTKAMETIKSEWLATPTLVAVLIGLFGLLALAITLSGVIGVISYNISQRIREIGIHMAIGATPANIVRMFLVQGLKVYGLGLLLGLAMLLLGAPLMAPLLYATSPVSPAVYFASALVLTLAVLIAMYLPARKASVLSPVAALHFE